MPNKILNLYTDGESFIYSPKEITGFLMLNYNRSVQQIYYKFFSEEVRVANLSVKGLRKKLNSMLWVIYTIFFKKYLTEFEDKSFNLSEFDEEDFEQETDLKS